MDGIKLYEVGGCDDYLEATVNRTIQIECFEPWAGDTESGFGRGGAVQLTKKQALDLAAWLISAAGSIKGD